MPTDIHFGVTKDELSVMRHALGLDDDGRGSVFRNHFCAGGKDVETCRGLVELGLMFEHERSDMTGGDPLFTVTANGKALAVPAVELPRRKVRR